MVVGAAFCLVYWVADWAGHHQLPHRLWRGLDSEQATRVSAQEQQAIDRAEALAQMSVQAQSRLTAMTRRLATLQAHVTRLDALGSHLTELAGLETKSLISLLRWRWAVLYSLVGKVATECG